ncbi:MAG TPA: 3-deoxy-D-manno-octulosonic acid transferase [Rhizomicrobium sp.]
MPASPFALLAYRYATMAFTPMVPFALRRRAARGKEDRNRVRERLGYPSLARPAGHLLWLHGASVGECLAALPLIGELLKPENRHVLVTSGTVTSATLMSERLPPRAFHQYVPVDTPSSICRFLDHWRPDIGLFVDSEIWPNMISHTHARDIPLALLNGRMSARSFAGWRRLRKSAMTLLGSYDLCLAQDHEAADRFAALGARNVQVSGSLKADARPLPADQGKLDELQHTIGARPVLLAASTHPGEDEIVLAAHDRMRNTHPDLLTIIAPRHPDRGERIRILCGERPAVQRSAGALPLPETTVYVADTLGELGLFYRLAKFAFIGGSLVPHGGQNPLEAARLGCGVLAGPHTENFALPYERIFAAQGAGRIASSAELADVSCSLIAVPANARAMGAAAARAAASFGGALERTRVAVEALLGHACA